MSRHEREPLEMEELGKGRNLPDAFEQVAHIDPYRQDPRDYRDPPLPRPKPAPKPKEPIVEHHANGTVETRYPDGSVNLLFRNGNSEFRDANGEIIRGDLRMGWEERIYRDGTREITHPDGSVWSQQPDGSELTVYANGNFDQRQPDGTVEHWRSRVAGDPPQRVSVEHPDQRWEAHRPDGTVITTFPDGKVSMAKPDGSVSETSLDQAQETRDPDGTVTRLYPNGNSERISPDGSVGKYDERDGSYRIDRPDGTAEVANGSDGSIQRIGPDEAVKTYPNGTKIIENRDGTFQRTNDQGVVLVVNHPDGTWDFHRLDGRVQQNWTDGTIVFDRPDGIQQIFWPDNSEELRDLLAGDEPVKKPVDPDIPILASPGIAAGAVPDTGMAPVDVAVDPSLTAEPGGTGDVMVAEPDVLGLASDAGPEPAPTAVAEEHLQPFDTATASEAVTPSEAVTAPDTMSPGAFGQGRSRLADPEPDVMAAADPVPQQTWDEPARASEPDPQPAYASEPEPEPSFGGADLDS